MELKIYNRNNALKLTLSPSDNSTRQKRLMGEHVLNLSFTSFECVRLEVYDYIDYDGMRFWVLEEYVPQQESTVEWSYNCRFYGIESLLKQALMLRTVDGENQPVFSLTAPARVHVALVVENINRQMGAEEWKVGQVVATENLTLDYQGTYCDEALARIAQAAGTEFWFDGPTVNLCRCEHGEPVSLGYGCGLLSLERQTAGNVKFFTRLFPLGSTRNIDPATYGFSRLQLPGRQMYVERNTHYGIVEHYEEEAFSGIYPQRTGTVAKVRQEAKTGQDGKLFSIYYFQDADLPFDPNDYALPGLTPQVTFSSGELSGCEFEVSYDSRRKEFEITTQWPYNDDTQLPGGLLVPKTGDRYILWNIRMPQSYYTLAEQTYAEAVEKYFDEHDQDRYVYRGTTDYVELQQRGLTLDVGQRVRLESDAYFPDAGLRLSRITSLTQPLLRPTELDLEMSDVLERGSLEKITDELSEVQHSVKQVATEFPDTIRSWEQTPASDTTLYTSRKSEREFLNKRRGGTVEAPVVFARGLQSDDYRAGALVGSGFRLGSNAAGDAVAEVDKLIVRKEAVFNELIINQVTFRTGETVFSNGGCELTRVEKLETVYRCYYDTRQGRRYSGLVEGDQVRCQRYDAHLQTVVKYYWRLVMSVGEDYVDLSQTDADGTGLPEAGDQVAQFGHRTDRGRQSAIVINPLGGGSVEVLAGIDAYTLSGKNYVGQGVNPATGRAYHYTYGDMFFGDRDLSDPDATFITYQQKDGDDRPRMHVKADLILGAGSSGLHNLAEWPGAQQQISQAGTAAAEAARQAAAALQSADTARRGVESLKDFSDAAFADGVVDRAEAVAIEKYANAVAETRRGVDASYATVYADPLLQDDAKANLAAAKKTFDTAAANLVASIRAAAADGVATPAEKEEVDRQYALFHSAYGTFTVRLQEANDAIAQTRVDDLRIGGVNLQNNSDFSQGTKNWTVGSRNYACAVSDGTLTITCAVAGEVNRDDRAVGIVDAAFDQADYVISMDVWCQTGTARITTRVFGTDPETNVTHDLTTTPRRIVSRHKGTTSYNQWGFAFSAPGTYHVRHVKVEAGNKATGWTPSPADVAAQIEAARMAAAQANAAIAAMNDDGIFDVNEKQTLRSEWEKITGHARVDTPIGQLPETEGAYYKVRASGLAAGVVVAPLAAALDALRERLHGYRLYENRNTAGFDRGALARLFTSYYAAQADVGEAIAQKRVDQIGVSARNLVCGSEHLTLDVSPDSQYHFLNLPLTVEVAAGEQYALSVETITVLAGAPARFTAALYDLIPDGPPIAVSEAALTQEQRTFVFRVKDGVAPCKARLLLYAGEWGHTAGCSVRYDRVMLVRGNKPALAWTEAPEDSFARVHAAQDTATEALRTAALAQTQLAAWGSDNYISPPEKTSLRQMQQDMETEYAEITTRARAYGVSGVAYGAAYEAAKAAFRKYTASTPQDIPKEADYAHIASYYTQRQVILETIHEAVRNEVAAAQQLAQAKSRIFVAQPAPPYAVGDLWAPGEAGEMKRCIRSRAEGAYVAADWVPAADYYQYIDRQISGIGFSAVNLLPASATHTLPASAHNYNFVSLPLTAEVSAGDELALSVGAITVLAGTPAKFTAALYDMVPDGGDLALSPGTITADRRTFVFRVKEGLTPRKARLLLYAGEWGRTAGCSVRYDRVMLVRGNKPSLSWSEAPEDTLVRIEAAQTAAENVQYLQRAFAKDQTLLAGGLVMGSFLGVKDSKGVVNAGIAGKNFLENKDFMTQDDSCPMIFAGATSATEANKAKFRVYPSGAVAMSQLIAQNGCQIGGFTIANGGALYNQFEWVADGISRMGAIALYSRGVIDIRQRVGYDSNESVLYMGYHNFAKTKDGHTPAISVGSYNSYHAGIMINVPANYSALEIASGCIRGFRRYMRYVTGSTTLTNLDDCIVANNSAPITLSLPGIPQDGEEYEVYKNTGSAQLTIDGSGCKITSFGHSIAEKQVLASGEDYAVRLTYSARLDLWFMQKSNGKLT